MGNITCQWVCFRYFNKLIKDDEKEGLNFKPTRQMNAIGEVLNQILKYKVPRIDRALHSALKGEVKKMLGYTYKWSHTLNNDKNNEYLI